MPKRDNTERDTQILELRKTGVTIASIAEQFNLSNARVMQIILSKTDRSERPNGPRNADRDGKLLELRKQGVSTRDLASRFQLSLPRVLQIIYKASDSTVKVSRRDMNAERDKNMIEEAKGGVSIRELARKYNLSNARVDSIVRKGGVSTRAVPSPTSSASISPKAKKGALPMSKTYFTSGRTDVTGEDVEEAVEKYSQVFGDPPDRIELNPEVVSAIKHADGIGLEVVISGGVALCEIRLGTSGKKEERPSLAPSDDILDDLLT